MSTVTVTVVDSSKISVTLANPSGGTSPFYEATVAARDAAQASETAAASSESAAAASESNAATSANQAATSASNASASESASATSAANASSFESKAQEWAENPEGTAVDTGAYSALHHAAKSASSASAAATSESNASISESNAASSASSAATSATNAATSETNAANSATAAATSESNAASSASAAATSETNAAASESGAATSESNASASESAAATSASNAAGSEAKAQGWAETPENTEVEPGAYSSLHHAAKAAASASSAATAADDAVAAHEGKTDPHPQYTDATEAAAAAPVQSVDGKTGAVDLSQDYETRRQHNLAATTDPTVNDDSGAGYEPLSKWVNTSTGEVFVCLDATAGASNWQLSTLTIDDLGSAATAEASDFAAASHSHNPSDVNQAGAVDGDALVWNDTTGQWGPGQVASGEITDQTTSTIYAIVANNGIPYLEEQ